MTTFPISSRTNTRWEWSTWATCRVMSAAEVVFRGDVATGRYLVFWMGSERVLAGMNVNIWHLTGAIRALVRSGARVDAAKLADPAVPLDEVFA